MLGRVKPHHDNWFSRARTALLVLLVFFALGIKTASTVPVQAQQGVAAGPYWQVGVEGSLTALAVDDLNGDHWAEIITGTHEGQVALWRAEGEPAWTFDVETDWVSGLSTGDLEGDGAREVLVTAGGILPTNYLYVLRADGQLLWSHSVRDELWGVHLLDMDGDGRREVLLAAQRPVILDDDGSELAGWPVDALRTPYVQVSDLDADGADEVVAIGETDVTILEADGTSRAWPHGLDGPISAAQTADLDGDGRSEVIITTEKAVTLFQGDGELVWSQPIEEPPAAVRAEDGLGVLVALEDAVVQLTAGGGEAWRFVAGPPASLPLVPSGTGLTGTMIPFAAHNLDVADPDADGTPEIVYGTAGGQVYLVAPLAGGEPMAEYAVGGAVTLVRYFDLNGDGHGEVLVGAGGILAIFGSPSGAATTRLRWTYAIRGAVTGLSAVDVDRDGRWEVVVGGRDKKVTLLDKEGAMVWQFAAADIVDGLSAGGSGEILVQAGSHLYLLAGDGSLLWQCPFDSPLRAVAWVHTLVPGLAVGLEDGRVMLLDAEDGAERWSYPFDRAVQAVGFSEGVPGMVVGLGDGRVAWLDDQERLLWEQDIGRVVSWLAVADVDPDGYDEVIARSGDNVFRLRVEDGTIAWRTETSAERLIDAALGDGVAVATDQRIYQLTASGLESWSYPLEEVASVVYTAKLDGEQGPVDVAVGTVKGGIYLLDTDGQLLWQGKGRERVNALHAADLNGDGRQELLVGMEDGVVQAYGLAVNQVPWLSTPGVTPVGGGYVYSVHVRDPEGDDVQVALEIWDPSARAWRAQEKSTALGGKGALSWNLPNPFDTWDAGRDSRFRFAWDDGQSQGTVAAVPGPLDIPVAPWYVFYGRYVLALVLVGAIPTLLLVVVRRARAYRRSPVGQAEAFLMRLTLEPEVLLPELHRLVTDEARAMTLLPHLPGLARQAGDEMIAGLAEGYYLILTRPDALRVAEGVKTIAGVLTGEDRAPLVEWKLEAQQVYEVLLAALQAVSVPRIVALSAQLGSLEDLSEDPDFFLTDTVRLMVILGQVSRTVSKLERVESSADQIAYLAEAMEVLGRCDRQARSDLVRPEQTILTHVVANWLPVITGALTGLQGRAELTLALKTRRVVAAGKEVVLVLTLNNVGRGPASDLVVKLLPGTGYIVGDGLAEMAVLPAGRTADVELRARPSPSVSAFRAEFRVTYDDRERAGKTELFADRVRLVAPPTVFRPVPNPYATGKPLRAGSPVFFGREDVFAFIRENLGGRAGENVLILVGERRMGKTSILRQLQLRLGEAIIPVFIDCQGVGMQPSMANLLYDISLEVQRGLAENGVKVELPPLVDFEARPTHAFERQLLTATQAELGDRTLLFLFDEFEELEARVRSGDLEEKVFAYLRHLVQHLEGVGFIFAGTHRLEELTADYWSTLFNIALYRRVGLLDENAARRLISEPVSDYGLVYDDLALDKMLKATAGHPYFLQLLCHTVVNIRNRERINYATVGDVNWALQEMLGLGEAHLAFLWERATPRERAILAALAQLVSAGRVGTAAAVASLLVDCGLETDPAEVERAMQRLAAQDLLQAAGEERACYEFQVDLVRLWIEQFKSLTQAVHGIPTVESPAGTKP
jgi:outer membrane protein assembly factor BamB